MTTPQKAEFAPIPFLSGLAPEISAFSEPVKSNSYKFRGRQSQARNDEQKIFYEVIK
ncbi:hypothetical protein MNBD_DELTA03-1029 [hydrothermal vent metagenome]|uniref:Uncharacterized protein n=1 Tax=hydrothermal vent metagenome TaxID=652676 RepID=A0A3B0VLH2_9ZZZZ